MTTHQTMHPDADRFDDLYWSPETERIEEDDAFLRAAISEAEMPVLLAALAAAIGDTGILSPDLRPPLTPMDTEPVPHGGMTADQLERASEVAFEALRTLRDQGASGLGKLTDAQTREVLGYLSNGNEDWFEMLSHELDLAPENIGRPAWTVQEIAPNRRFETLIVGAGVAGIAAAHRFRQAGLPYTHIESTTEIGGTWAKNSYPGVRLDTPTFGYSFSFAQRGDWPNQFARGEEIREYLVDVAERAGIVENIQFGTRLVRLRWIDADAIWEATTAGPDDSEQTHRFHAVVSGLGQLDRPNIPEIPGAEGFRGVTMHSQEWDHSVDLTGKRVAVVGTGASAYQIVPAIVDQVDRLAVFQRSAPWMLPAPNYHDATTETFAWLTRKVPHYAQWFRLWVTLTSIEGRVHTVTAEDDWDGAPLSVSRKNQEIREYLTQRVVAQLDGRADLIEHMIPGYPPGAKRMLRDNGVWTAALRAEKTTLVTSGIDRYTATGIVDSEGVIHEVDAVIYATGFTPSDYLEGVEVLGRDGLNIHDFWDGDARAYNGITVPGFPNLFLIYGPNMGLVVRGSTFFMLERAVEYSLTAIRELLQRDLAALDVRPEALDRFIECIDAENRRMAWGQPYVRTWYQNRFGRVSQIWPYTNIDYMRRTESIVDADYEFLS